MYEFKVFGKGLFAYDYKKQKPVEYKQSNTHFHTHSEPFSFLNSVAISKSFFSRAEIEGANEATLLQRHICWNITVCK